MKKGKKLYEGKAKIIYATNDKDLVIQYFKDDATAFNNQKKTTIEGKGVLNNRISEHILSNLGQIGIKNHLVKRLNMREQIIKLVEIIPIEFSACRCKNFRVDRMCYFCCSKLQDFARYHSIIAG